MRIISELARPGCKITIFAWNGKYLVKIEQGPLEQTFKIPEHAVSGEADVHKLVSSPEFVDSALKRFEEMRVVLSNALSNL